MPKVSVIVPTYNCMRYLPEAIESVLRQTYDDYEIIIIDDGSTDKTKDVLAKYLEAYPDKIRYIFQENAGEGGARNRGIREARGEYVSFLDADDIYLPKKLERQMAAIDSLENKDVVIYGDAYTFNETGKIVGSMFNERKPHYGRVYERILFENFVVTQAVMTKRDFFDKVGYFKEEMRYCADFDMWLRLAKNYEYYYVDEVIAGYRIHSTQVSRNIHRMRDHHLTIVNSALGAIRSNKRLINAILANQHFKYGRNFWHNNFIKDARKDFWLSLKYRIKSRTLFYFLLTFLPLSLVKNIRSLKSKMRRGLYSIGKGLN